MTRRDTPVRGAVRILALILAGTICAAQEAPQPAVGSGGDRTDLYVSPGGDDADPGTRERPFKTFAKAAGLARPGTTIHLLPPATHIYISPAGKDDAPGTADRPRRSLQAALAAAKPGTVVHAAAGVYGPVSLENAGGDDNNPIVVRGPIPPPVDYSTLDALGGQALRLEPIRQALTGGRFTLAGTNGLAVVDAAGAKYGISLRACRGLVFENLVVQNAGVNLDIHESHHLTLRDLVVREARTEGVEFSAGVHLTRSSQLMARQQYGRDRPDAQSDHFLLQRITSYGHWGEGFWIDVDAVTDVEFDRCIAHNNGRGQPPPSRFVHNRSGFIYRPAPRSYPRHRFIRCASLDNIADGFDLGRDGIGGLVLEYCVAEGNGQYGPPFVNLRLGGGVPEGHVFRNCLVVQPVAFEGGVHELDGLFIQPAGVPNRRAQ